VPADSREWRPDDVRAGTVGAIRSPKAVLGRALLGGVTAGGLLGALVVLPDSLKAQFAPEPDTAYAASWFALLVAVPIGALVGFMPALLAVVVWEWQIPQGVRRARVAGSAMAALAVVATPGVLPLVDSSPASASWTISSLVFLAIAALASFTIAYLSVPAITTKGRRSLRQRLS